MNLPYRFTTNAIHYLICFLATFVFFSCQNKSKEKTVKTDSLNSKIVIKNKSGHDTLITTPCAILIYPTLKQIEKMKMEVKDSDDFYTAADDNQYYMGTSIEFLDSVKVKRFGREANGFITFKTNKGQVFKTNIDSLGWNILLFNGKDKPRNADIMMIQDDYKSYMKLP
jgi:hypothetical protein